MRYFLTFKLRNDLLSDFVIAAVFRTYHLLILHKEQFNMSISSVAEPCKCTTLQAFPPQTIRCDNQMITHIAT